jgi:hypothetical protein
VDRCSVQRTTEESAYIGARWPRTSPHLNIMKKEAVPAIIGFYWFFCSLTACAFSSSAFCQLALGLYSFIDLAATSVFLPRSF